MWFYIFVYFCFAIRQYGIGLKHGPIFMNNLSDSSFVFDITGDTRAAAYAMALSNGNSFSSGLHM